MVVQEERAAEESMKRSLRVGQTMLRSRQLVSTRKLRPFCVQRAALAQCFNNCHLEYLSICTILPFSVSLNPAVRSSYTQKSPTEPTTWYLVIVKRHRLNIKLC